MPTRIHTRANIQIRLLRERERTHVTRSMFSELKRRFDETKFDDGITGYTASRVKKRGRDAQPAEKQATFSRLLFFFSCFFLRNFIVMRFDFARTCAPDLLTLHDDSRFSINRDIGLHSWQWYTHAESTGRHENRVSQRLSENQADCLYLYTSRHSAETVSSGASPTSRARVPNKKKHASKTHDFTLFVNRLQTIFFFFLP